jgi:mono/diheme cytochrome c family protein
VAAVAGLLDWQHFYHGVWTTPFIVKMVLAALLTISLAVAVFKGMKKDVPVKRLVPIYFFSLVTVAGLGFIGGELVYGTRGVQSLPPDSGQAPAAAPVDKTDHKDPSANRSPEGPEPDPALVGAGKALFGQKCSFCHHTESTDAKIGPGLKGLFERDRLPVSKLPVTEKNVRSQIRKPYDSMPPFPDLPAEDVEAVVAYLKTI